eukprot:UN19486
MYLIFSKSFHCAKNGIMCYYFYPLEKMKYQHHTSVKIFDNHQNLTLPNEHIQIDRYRRK